MRMDNLLYIIFFIIGLFVFMQLYVRISTWKKKGKKIENIGGELGRKLEDGDRHLIYFYTRSCSACKTMTPVVDTLTQGFKNIHKINLATDMETARKFGVMGTPATVVVENSKIISYVLGYKNASFLRNLLTA